LWSKVRRTLAELSERIEFFRKIGSEPSRYSKQMPVLFARLDVRSHLFEIIFATKTAQISGFQMKKQRV